ncbi:unnamed protein product [Caretta caretta]
MDYRITLEVLNDVLSALTSLSTLLQKRGLTPLEAFHLARGKLNKIRRQYLGDSVLWSDKVKALLDMSSRENNEIDTSSIITFIHILCAHLADRFPEDEVQEWSAFDSAAIGDKGDPGFPGTIGENLYTVRFTLNNSGPYELLSDFGNIDYFAKYDSIKISGASEKIQADSGRFSSW